MIRILVGSTTGSYPVYKYGRKSKSGVGVSQHMRRLERSTLTEKTSCITGLQSANCSIDLFKYKVAYVTTDSEPLIQGLYGAYFYESDARLLHAHGRPVLLAQIQAAKLTLGNSRSLHSRSPSVEVDKAISILMKSRRVTGRPARLGCQVWCTSSSTSPIPATLRPIAAARSVPRPVNSLSVARKYTPTVQRARLSTTITPLASSLAAISISKPVNSAIASFRELVKILYSAESEIDPLILYACRVLIVILRSN